VTLQAIGKTASVRTYLKEAVSLTLKTAESEFRRTKELPFEASVDGKIKTPTQELQKVVDGTGQLLVSSGYFSGGAACSAALDAACTNCLSPKQYATAAVGIVANSARAALGGASAAAAATLTASTAGFFAVTAQRLVNVTAVPALGVAGLARGDYDYVEVKWDAALPLYKCVSGSATSAVPLQSYALTSSATGAAVALPGAATKISFASVGAGYTVAKAGTTVTYDSADKYLSARAWNASAGAFSVLGSAVVASATATVTMPALGAVGLFVQAGSCNAAAAPCLHAGACSEGVTVGLNAGWKQGFGCKCAAGWAGATCSADIKECASSPCQNGGACRDGNAGAGGVGADKFVCDCAKGFSGALCANDIDECNAAPCKFGGNCTDSTDDKAVAAGDFRCACLPARGGKTCTDDFDECAVLAPCKNGAKCTHKKFGDLKKLDARDASNQTGARSFACACGTGFSGATCTEDFDECKAAPCENNVRIRPPAPAGRARRHRAATAPPPRRRRRRRRSVARRRRRRRRRRRSVARRRRRRRLRALGAHSRRSPTGANPRRSALQT